jgi:hypothetical protein
MKNKFFTYSLITILLFSLALVQAQLSGTGSTSGTADIAPDGPNQESDEVCSADGSTGVTPENKCEDAFTKKPTSELGCKSNETPELQHCATPSKPQDQKRCTGENGLTGTTCTCWYKCVKAE